MKTIMSLSLLGNVCMYTVGHNSKVVRIHEIDMAWLISLPLNLSLHCIVPCSCSHDVRGDSPERGRRSQGDGGRTEGTAFRERTGISGQDPNLIIKCLCCTCITSIYIYIQSR